MPQLRFQQLSVLLSLLGFLHDGLHYFHLFPGQILTGGFICLLP